MKKSVDKNQIIDIVTPIVVDYSTTSWTTKVGKILRKVSKIVGKILPAFKS